MSSYGSPGNYLAGVRAGTHWIFSPEQRVSLQWIPMWEGWGKISSRKISSSPASQPFFEEGLTAYIWVICGSHSGALIGLLELIVFDPCKVSLYSVLNTRRVCYQFSRFCRSIPGFSTFGASRLKFFLHSLLACIQIVGRVAPLFYQKEDLLQTQVGASLSSLTRWRERSKRCRKPRTQSGCRSSRQESRTLVFICIFASPIYHRCN